MRHVGNQHNDVAAGHSEASNLIRTRRHPRQGPDGWTQAERFLEHGPGVRQRVRSPNWGVRPPRARSTSVTTRDHASGWRSSRQIAQVSVVAVVSNPAISRVMTSSRNRRGLIWFSSAS